MVDPPRLFVYGTLMPGRLRWPVLEPFAARHRAGAVSGALYDSGRGWPVAVFGDGPGRIPGRVVDVDPGCVDACLELIDRVEETETDELRRVSVLTDAGEQAWAYDFTPATDGLTPIADWATTSLELER